MISLFPALTSSPRFAFLDFITPQHATAALVDPRNFSLDGRTLKLEFASADAVRRGGNLPKPSKDGAASAQSHSKSERGPKKSESGAAIDTAAELETSRKPSRAHGRGVRQRPGAALASAQREQARIVPSIGKKIVF